MFSARIDRSFDSHVHWAGIGEAASELKLHHLGRPEDIKHLKLEKHHERGRWLVGYGWDQNQWPEKAFPQASMLDQWVSSERPIAFFRADRHAVWVNTSAMIECGIINRQGALTELGKRIPQEQILFDDSSRPTGIFLDMGMNPFEEQIPRPSPSDVRHHLMSATQKLHRAGFTHIRDMTMDAIQWSEACHLADSGWLQLAVESYFSTYSLAGFDRALELATQAKKERRKTLRALGVKFFMDGALGSEGAWLSRSYSGSNQNGLQLYKQQEIEEFIRRAWERDLEVAIHTIGDEAVAQAVEAYHNISGRGLRGKMALEHTEIVRAETIQRMRGLNITCHLQPCHWLSDRNWLKDKVGELFNSAFPWRALQESEIEFYFGSDAPIEALSVANTLKALEDSGEKGIPRLLGDGLRYHSHPDPSWAPNTYSIFKDGLIDQIVFCGEHLL